MREGSHWQLLITVSRSKFESLTSRVQSIDAAEREEIGFDQIGIDIEKDVLRTDR